MYTYMYKYAMYFKKNHVVWCNLMSTKTADITVITISTFYKFKTIEKLEPLNQFGLSSLSP